MHVHTRRSDGTGTLEQVAAAASRAGLQFVIVTDHGDGMREAEPPSYRSGVLCIEAVEISTDGGHLVALDMPPSIYPLGGEARDVLEDVRRLGGFSIVSHPDSARAALRWTDEDAVFDGLEWINGDSQWRDESWGALGRALLTYPLRPSATLTALLDRPEAELARWDRLTAGRPVVALAASDAHARLGFGSDPYDGTLSLRVPAYEQVFRMFSISLPGVRLSGSAREDARAVIDAIRRGEVYSAIDGLAGPAVLAFSAAHGSARVGIGGSLPLAESIEVRVEANSPPTAEIVLLRNGEEVASSTSSALTFPVQTGGAYRVEVRLQNAPGRPPVPWIVSNPIYVGLAAAVPVPSPDESRGRTGGTGEAVYLDGPATGWRVEKNPASEGAIHVAPTVEGTQLSLRYGLGGRLSEGPYVALVAPRAPALEGFTRLTFMGRSLRPMRLSVQVRDSGPGQGRRWRRSVFLDEMARAITVDFDDMTPVGAPAGSPSAGDLLFVVDAVNAEPGSNGQIWLDDVRYER
jgi:hypothetical protein